MVKEEKDSSLMANPYNKTKQWENENTDSSPFVSADDSLAYVKKQKYAVIDPNPKPKEDVEEQKEEVKAEEVAQEDDSTPELYKKVDYKKRYDDLKRHYDKKLNEFKQEKSELLEQIKTNSPKYTPPKSLEELEKFKEENPDVYNIVESVAHMQATKQMEELQEELKQVKEKLMLEEAQRAYAELKAAVPDYEQIRRDEKFHTWAEQQPKEIQDWIYRNSTNVQLAIQAINLYKASVGQTPKATSQPVSKVQSDDRGRADMAVSATSRTEEPSNNKGKIWTRTEIKKLSSKQYEKLKDEIDRAFFEGRVVND